MKPTRILKPWVEKTILIIQFMLFILLICESNSIIFIIISKVVAIIMMLLNHSLLINHTKLFDNLDEEIERW